MIRLCCALVSIVVTGLVTGTAPVQAQGVPVSRLMGKWCGDVTNYIFTRDSLTVQWRDDGTRRRFVVTKIVPGPDYLDVKWVRDDAPQNTVFAKFSADGQRMAQMPNTSGDMGPERAFRRCK